MRKDGMAGSWMAVIGVALALASCESSGGGTDLPAGDVAGDAAAATFAVTYKGASVEPDLSKAEDVTINGTACKKLSSVALLAFPEIVLDAVVVDFTGSEGFKPASKPYCTGLIPFAGTSLANGCIDPATRNLQWDESLSWPGCMSVKGTVEMELADKQG
jgi:hypothetical protein